MDVFILVRARDDHRCQRCGRSVVNAPSSVHHRKLRSQGGRDEPDNLVTLCGSGTTGCHGWAHANPTIARSHGFIVWRIRNPAEVPVETFHGWFWLDPTGGKTPATKEELDAYWGPEEVPTG